MHRFYQNKKELFIGSPCDIIIPMPNGWKKVHYDSLTKDMVILLGQMGIINIVEDKKEVKKDKQNVGYFIRRFGTRNGLDKEASYRFINFLVDIAPSAALNILLKEIALELDRKYKDHIRDSKEIYVISSLNGQIYLVNKENITNYRNFAAFRTLEDAQYAISVLGEFFKDSFTADRPVVKDE